MSVVVTVAYIAAVVELSLACLCSQLCYIVELQYQDLCTFNQKAHPCPGCCQSSTAVDLMFKHTLFVVRSDAVVAAMLIREGFSDEVANVKE
jgi:hypothetical protein